MPLLTAKSRINLGSWVSEQRVNQKKLGDERRAQLEAVPGWSWNSIASSWADKLVVLRAFSEREGHARVPVDHVENGIKLGSWVRTQRKTREKMTTDQRALLEGVAGWTWQSPHVEAWDQHYAAMQTYAGREGHSRVPHRHTEAGLKLGQWVVTQRASRNDMPAERGSLLEEISGWTWDPFADAWAASLDALHSFAEREGHARVPQRHVENEINLGSWVSVQRAKKDQLTDQRRAQLEAIRGWSWNPHADGWAQKYTSLLDFVNREGHARVPYSHVENGIKLGTWVYSRRKKKTSLTTEERARLEALPGWTW
ncbi:helicase associated domain-containing protein [Speluncibacter jeojiensis]|uniref:Helicase associated domain-containing protein n=1 Tax=Speluncibacter jeojiensis TaxID=2710754 RepID=A0A9X4RFA1_9ACTN|nr:helicase associated domain-containing protein [Corynebacteriales bacterium D3-21]